jgi:hypothetical protein
MIAFAFGLACGAVAVIGAILAIVWFVDMISLPDTD